LSSAGHRGVRLIRIPAVGVLAGLVLLFLAGTAWAQTAEEVSPKVCTECHAFVSQDVVNSWQAQNHGQNGVGCPVCHATHEQDFRPSPTVAICMECHDVPAVHPGYAADDSAGVCMECHSSNIHVLPGEGSWFLAGLPPEQLEATPQPESVFSLGEARTVAIVVVLVGAVSGVLFGLVLDRFIRNL